MDNRTTSYGIKTLLALTMLACCLLFGLICAAIFVFISAVSWFFPDFMVIGVVILKIFIAAGVVFTVAVLLSIILGVEIFPKLSIRYVLMKYIVPVARSIAKRIGLNADTTVRSFILLNNEFILKSIKNKTIHNVLLLLPYCIQLQSCGMKLTSDITNCKKCGKCVISRLIELSDRLSVYISVASGGTMARKQLAEKQPNVVLAVACERDLLSGIRDTLPMPVIGVINQRPEGPCVNTTVDIECIATLIEKIKTNKNL